MWLHWWRHIDVKISFSVYEKQLYASMQANFRWSKIFWKYLPKYESPIFYLLQVENRMEKSSIVQFLWPFYFGLLFDSYGKFFKT